MTETPTDIYRLTQSGLESGLRVGHIATTPIQTCDVEENTAAVLADPRFAGFDQIPVRSDGRVVGVYEPGVSPRNDSASSGAVKHHMRPLDESLLVSAELPLTKFMAIIRTNPYRLVVEGTAIQGIVTWSDLQKLPVRLYVFSLVTHLEMLMLDIIRSRKPRNEDWLDLLPPARQSKIKKDFERFRAARLDPAPLEFTSFGDKRRIVVALLGLDDSASAELCDLQVNLRDAVDHSAAYADSPAAVQDFARRLETAQRWIDCLTPKISVTDEEGVKQ
jgi:predicted transcriptional regulator